MVDTGSRLGMVLIVDGMELRGGIAPSRVPVVWRVEGLLGGTAYMVGMLAHGLRLHYP